MLVELLYAWEMSTYLRRAVPLVLPTQLLSVGCGVVVHLLPPFELDVA